MEMKRYKVVVVDKSMNWFEPETYFIEYYDIKSIIMLITEEQEIVKIELIEDEEDEEDEQEIEQLMECDYEDLKDDKSIN